MRPFYTLYEQNYSNMRQLTTISFPQGFGKLKKFGHRTLGSGGTKRFKWSEQREKINKKKLFSAAAILNHF